jgi:hypothetical protein
VATAYLGAARCHHLRGCRWLWGGFTHFLNSMVNSEHYGSQRGYSILRVSSVTDGATEEIERAPML